MKTLILTQCHLKTEQQGRLLGTTVRLAQRLNPGYDVLLMDNASPIDPTPFLPKDPAVEIERFPDAIGHFSHKFADEREDRRDGPGRAIMTGLQAAIDSGYDRLVYLEDDCLFARPFEEGFAQMTKPVACLPRGRWGYLDWNMFWVADLAWLKASRFIERYDWPTQKQGPGNEGERIYENLLVPNLNVLPFKGGRGEGYVNAHNLRAVYPACDFLTHVDRECYAEFLRMNGHNDLADKL